MTCMWVILTKLLYQVGKQRILAVFSHRQKYRSIIKRIWQGLGLNIDWSRIKCLFMVGLPYMCRYSYLKCRHASNRVVVLGFLAFWCILKLHTGHKLIINWLNTLHLANSSSICITKPNEARFVKLSNPTDFLYSPWVVRNKQDL